MTLLLIVTMWPALAVALVVVNHWGRTLRDGSER